VAQRRSIVASCRGPVVGQDGAPPAEQERDTFDLVREEPVGERDGALECTSGSPDSDGCAERLGLRVERVGHGFGARTAQERQFVTVEENRSFRAAIAERRGTAMI
jgi:hypothetical protein